MQVVPNTRSARPINDLIRQARNGVLRQRVDAVVQKVRLTDKEMAHILNMSVRSLHGKSANQPLSLAASERLLLFEHLVQHGLSVFDGRAHLLERWFRTPLAELAYGSNLDEPPPLVDVRTLGGFEKPIPGYADQPTDLAGGKIEISSITPAQSPLSVLDTVSGFSLVDDVLGRIEWGIVS